MSEITISYRLIKAQRAIGRLRAASRPEHIVRCESFPPRGPFPDKRALCGVLVLGRGWARDGQPYQSGCAACVREWLRVTGTATISVNDIIAGRLPEDASAVYWRDTRYTECRPHLTWPDWAAQVTRSSTRAGIVLTMAQHGPVICDACEEAVQDPVRRAMTDPELDEMRPGLAADLAQLRSTGDDRPDDYQPETFEN